MNAQTKRNAVLGFLITTAVLGIAIVEYKKHHMPQWEKYIVMPSIAFIGSLWILFALKTAGFNIPFSRILRLLRK